MTLPKFGGSWTEQKLEILRRYLDRYTTVLKKWGFTLYYVDGFAGAGSYIESRDDYAEFDEFRQGSARIALAIDDKPFDKLVFVEKEASSAETLFQIRGEYPDRQIEIIQGDANDRVPRFCHNMGDFDRAVVFLDPYATEVSWSTVEAIAASQKIDCWILFPLMAVTRMMPTDKEPDEATANQLDRIFGGRDYWRQRYQDSPQLSLLDDEPRRERAPGSQQIADSYRGRLNEVFYRVAKTPRTLRNSKNVPLFELFFAAGNLKGAGIAVEIADHILKHW
jgi:three-Cys-motif partner protein